MSPELPEELQLRIDEICSEHSMVLLELVQRGSKAKPVFEVIVDSEAGVDFNSCRAVHREVEALLDAAPGVSESYRLDVTSPGIDRPLEFEWQYRKNIGRKVLIETSDDKVINGRIKGIENELVVVEKGSSSEEVAMSNISKAVIEIEF